MLADEQITQVDDGEDEDTASSSDPGTNEDNVSSGSEAVDYVTSEQFAGLVEEVQGISGVVSDLSPATRGDVMDASDAVVVALSSDDGGTSEVVTLSDEQYESLRSLVAGCVVGSLCVCAIVSVVCGLLLARAFAGRWSRG